uniref:Uncharacterized protein n=1 Tax=Trichogramma kaykai TaxID=54128 RepID=A0ABD2WRR2_9HYME
MFTRCRCVYTRVRARAYRVIPYAPSDASSMVFWIWNVRTFFMVCAQHTDVDESEKHAKTSSRDAARCHLG